MAQTKSPVAQSAPAALVPFVAAAHEHTEPFMDVTLTPGASAVLIGSFDVPAYGFMRSVIVQSEASGGTIGAGVFHPDAPFNAYTELSLLDVNGTPIFGPYTGYMTFLVNLLGGYSFDSDPRDDPDYNATIGWAFMLRLPVEISHHDGFGSLGNENSAANYKFRATLNLATGALGIFTTAPTTVPAVRTRAYLEAWSQPADVDPMGRRQSVAPPRHGTTQFWTYTQRSITAGTNLFPIPRVGNLLRTFIFVVRDTTANLNRVSAANMPDPVRLRWDSREMYNESKLINRKRTQEALATKSANPLPAGVTAWLLDRQTLGHAGDGSPALWYPTLQSSRVEFQSDNFPVAGNLDILINDVALAEVNPDQRYVDTSATAFHPQPSAAPTRGA